MLKLKLQYFLPPDVKSWLIWKVPDAGKDWGQEEKGMTEDEMVGWYHRLNGHGFGWTPGVGDGQGGLVCCSSWGRKESDMTEQLNWTGLNCVAGKLFNPHSPNNTDISNSHLMDEENEVYRSEVTSINCVQDKIQSWVRWKEPLVSITIRYNSWNKKHAQFILWQYGT